MKAVIIDFTRNSEIRILNTRISSSVTVLAGYYLTLSSDEDPVRAAALKLQEERLLDLPAFIIPAAELVEKHLFHLPKMPDKDIKKVLPREIANVRDSEAETVFNYMDNGIIEERQVEKMEVAAFFSLKEKIFNFLNRLKSEGIHPARLIPEAQGLKTLMVMNPQLRSERTGVVLLDLMDNRINLNIFKNEYWGLEREFMFRMESKGDLSDEDFTRISTELTRTFQYFKQRNRSYTIQQVIIYGSSSNTGHLKNLISDNLAVPASIIHYDSFRSKISLPAHLRESREFIALFTLPLATSLAIATNKYLDLFPDEYKEQSRMPRRLMGLGISTVIIAAILTGSTIYFQNIKNSYIKDIERIKKTYLSLSQNAAVIQETKQKRAEFYKRRYYIDYPLEYSFATANFIRQLSLIAVEEIELKELEFNPSNQSFTFLLSGRIKAANNIEAQSTFLDFYKKIKQFDNLLRIDSSNVNVSPREARPGLPAKPADQTDREEKEVELYFTIDGEVETGTP